MNCSDCKFFKKYRGTRDRYGLQQEPDDYDCTSSRATEEDLDKYFCDAEEWNEGQEGCRGFERKYTKEVFEE